MDVSSAGTATPNQDATATSVEYRNVASSLEELRLLKEALQSTREGVTIADMRQPDAPLIYVNHGFEVLTGYTASEVLGKNCRFLQGSGTDPKAVDQIREALRHGRPCSVDLLNYRKDGTPFWNRLSLAPIRDSAGHVTHYVGVQSDITEQVEAEQEVRIALELLERTNQQLSRANRRMKHSLEAAAKVQRAFLPSTVPRSSRVRFDWRYFPCDELAGDILNVSRLDADTFSMYLLDVTGHGTPAALLAVSVSQILAPISSASTLVRDLTDSGEPAITAPAEVAMHLNKRFRWEAETAQFFTLVYALLDTSQYELRLVCAGHPGPIVLSRNGKSRHIRTRDLPIGIGDGHYEEVRVTLQPGDRVYFFSDGVTDALNAANQPFGLQRLCAAVRSALDQPLSKSLDYIITQVQAWTESKRFADDLSLLAFEMLDPSTRAVREGTTQ